MEVIYLLYSCPLEHRLAMQVLSKEEEPIMVSQSILQQETEALLLLTAPLDRFGHWNILAFVHAVIN